MVIRAIGAVRRFDAARYGAGVVLLAVLGAGCSLVLDEQLLIQVEWGTDCETKTQSLTLQIADR